MRKRKPKREALVRQHLENVSRELLEVHRDVVKNLIGRNSGIYALYKGKKLYYVGLASALRSRLDGHLKNRHGKAWDRFSVYLTIKDQHLREIEALMHRIASPPGGKQKGKLAASSDMRRLVASAIKSKQAREVNALFGARKDDQTTKPKVERELLKYVPNGAKIRGVHKGKIFNGRIRPDGRVRFNGSLYNSLSVAAAKALGRASNGWWFWQIERGKNNWVRLLEIRKAGTPI